MENKNIVKIVSWIVLFAIFFFPIIGEGLAESDISLNPNDYARITEMDYKAVVVDEPGSKGKIVVTERITFDVHAASRTNGFWELWRDLCEDYVDGLKVYYKVNSVKQILPDGQEVIWPESPQLYWEDSDYESWNQRLGPGKWYHSEGPYNESRRQYECVFFYVDNLYREEVVFEIEYEMYNAVLRYNDCSDLYIAMYSGDTTKYLKSFKGEILIPNKDMPKEGNYKVTTYGTNSNSFPVEESKTKNPGYHTFSFDLTEDELKFKSYNNYIEFDLVSYGDDKHAFADHASKNDYYKDDVLDEIWAEQEEYASEPIKAKSTKTAVLICCIIASVIVVFLGLKKIYDFKRKYPFYTSEPVCGTYRDIPSDLDPKLAAALVFCKEKKPEDDAGVYSAILLSLARKKYIELDEREDDDVLITIKNEETLPTTAMPNSISETFDAISTMDQNEPFGTIEWVDINDQVEPVEQREPLTNSEMHYLDLLKRHASSNCISMSTLQKRIATDYAATSGFVGKIKRCVVDCGINLNYLQKADYLEPKRKLSSTAKAYLICGIIALLVNLITCHTRLDFAFGGFFLLSAVCVAVGMYLKSQSHKYVLLTKDGEREYTKWRGLYNFLKSDTLINEKTVIELPLWEKYLVYATAFGISEKVIKAIKIHCKDLSTESIVNNTYCRYGRIHSSGRRFHSSVRSAHHSFHSSISGGGGFGYGGGGRGGGGGGGGH